MERFSKSRTCRRARLGEITLGADCVLQTGLKSKKKHAVIPGREKKIPRIHDKGPYFFLFTERVALSGPGRTLAMVSSQLISRFMEGLRGKTLFRGRLMLGYLSSAHSQVRNGHCCSFISSACDLPNCPHHPHLHNVV